MASPSTVCLAPLSGAPRDLDAASTVNKRMWCPKSETASRNHDPQASTHMTTNPQQRNPLGLIFTLGCLFGLLSGCGPSMPQEPVPLKIGERTFAMRLACDPASRERGLGGVRELPDSEGMIFAFPQRSVRAFWMKDAHRPRHRFVDDQPGRSGQMKAEPPRGRRNHKRPTKFGSRGSPISKSSTLRVGVCRRNNRCHRTFHRGPGGI